MSQDARKSSAGATVHNVNPSQEIEYNLPIVGESGGVAGSCLSGESRSNYPDVRLCTSTMKSPFCASSVASSRVAVRLGRPDGAETWCKLTRKAQVRSTTKKR